MSFHSQRGSYLPNPAPTNVISSWVFTDAAAVPQTGDENIRLNINGNPPTDSNEVEFIIRSFQFVPLGSPRPAMLAQPRLQNVQFSFDLLTQRDRRYQVQVSTNLASWQNLDPFLATNEAMSFAATNNPPARPCFYRAVTLP